MSSRKCLGLDELRNYNRSLRDYQSTFQKLADSGEFNPSKFRQFLSTLTVQEASNVIECVQSVGGITRVDFDIPDPDNLIMSLLVCYKQIIRQEEAAKYGIILPPVAIFLIGRPVSILLSAKKIQSMETEPNAKPQFEIEEIVGDEIKKKTIPLSTFLAEYLVQKPDEIFDQDISALVHRHSAARVRAFLNACQIPDNIYNIFDGGIAPYACLSPSAHSQEYLLSDISCNSYDVTMPKDLELITDYIRTLTSVVKRKEFLTHILTQPSEEMRRMGTQQDYSDLVNHFPNCLISCLVGGPLTGLLETHRLFPTLTDKVVEFRAMSMAHTGKANLFGNNFNIMVDPKATIEMLQVFQSLDIQIVCVSSETCKTPVYTVSGPEIRSISSQSGPISFVGAIIDQWTNIKGAVQPCYDATVVETIYNLVRSVDVVPIQYEWTQNPKPQMSQIPGLEHTGLSITPIGTALTPDSIYSPGVYITGTTFTDQARDLFLDLFRMLA